MFAVCPLSYLPVKDNAPTLSPPLPPVDSKKNPKKKDLMRYFCFLFMLVFCNSVGAQLCSATITDEWLSTADLIRQKTLVQTESVTVSNSWIVELGVYSCGLEDYISMRTRKKVYFLHYDRLVWNTWTRSDNKGKYYHNSVEDSELIIGYYRQRQRQCTETTKSGERCIRFSNDSKCWQHG